MSASSGGSCTSPWSSQPGSTTISSTPGTSLGAVPAGYYTIDAMRLEKGYRAFARELVPDATPIEAGLGFTCKLAGGVDFLGRGGRRAGQGRRGPTAGRLDRRR
jgi:glycine cleavage system aminomethyltransferase T